MKINILMLTILTLTMLLFIGCTETEKTIYSEDLSKTPKLTETGMWQEAYIAFLRNFSASTESGVSEFALRDLDNNSVPELIITQTDANAMSAVLTVYSYDGNVYKVGDYSNPKESFVSGFRFSNKLAFPGLFEVWWGGGIEHYGYLTVKKRNLAYEYLYYILDSRRDT